MKPRRLALYALALLLSLAMLAVREGMPVSFGQRPLLILFMFPVIVSALLGGLGPGLLATAAVGGLTAFFLVLPTGSVALPAGHDLVQWAMLVANGVLVSLMSHFMFRARRQGTAAQEERRQSEASFQAIFEQAAVGIVQVSEEGRFQRVNGKFCEILGYSQAELQARTFMDVTHPDDLPADLDNVRRLHAGEIPSFSREKRFLRKDGTPVWASINITAVRKLDGTPDYRIGVIEDISARKAAELALRDRERKLDAIVGHSPSALSLKTPEGCYALANPNLQRIHHLSEAQIIGKNDFDLYPEEIARAFRANDEFVLNTRTRHSIEEVLPVDGEPRSFMSQMFPVFGADGSVEFICRISLDITDRKHTDEMLRTALAEQTLARRAALNLMEDAQDAKSRAEAALASLQESEGRFRALVEQSLAGIYIIQDGLFRYVNPLFSAMFGFAAAEDIVDRVPFTDLVAPEDLDRVAENVRRRAQGETREDHYVFKGLRRDGQRIDLEVHGHAFEYQGQPGVIGLILDISARVKAEAEAHRNEVRFQALVDQAADALFVHGQDGRFAEVNRLACESTGYSKEELLTLGVADLEQDFDLAGAQAIWEQIEPGQYFTIEGRHRRKDGSTFPVEVRLGLMIQDGRRVYISLVRDISDRKRAQAELAEREARYRAVIESTPDGFWMVDTEGRIQATNEAYARFSGYSEEELLRMHVPELEVHESPEEVQAHVEQIMRAGSAVFESEHRAKDGRIWPVEVAVSYWPMAEGYMFAFLRDITTRKAAEAAMMDLNRRMRTLIDTIPDLVWLKDTQGVYQACNTRFEALFGAREADIVGKTDYDFLPQELAEFVRASDRAAIDAGKPLMEEEREVVFISDGHLEFLQAIKAPFYDGQGKLIGVLGIARDNSERKAAEAELKARNEELLRFNRATVGRELDMIEMKKRINALTLQLGREPPYPLAFLNDPAASIRGNMP